MRGIRLIVALGLGTGLALLATAPAWAQQVEIVAPPPERVRLPEFVLPGQPPQITHPRETDFTPDNTRARHDPAFIAPFTTTVRTGPTTAVRFGLSGWTAPPVHRDVLVAREASGWFALGFTFIWDVPIEPPKPRASSVVPAALR
ncbi:MAG: hypothetical protein HY726_19440 [Candidatus Rokubacteria bacterium]|nr:hypothetical protein [Candidatus Rokubacteria bacterium]